MLDETQNIGRGAEITNRTSYKGKVRTRLCKTVAETGPSNFIVIQGAARNLVQLFTRYNLIIRSGIINPSMYEVSMYNNTVQSNCQTSDH